MGPDHPERAVLAEQVHLLYANGPLTYRLALFNACLVYAVLVRHVPQEPLLIWLALVLTITLSRYTLVALYWRSGDGPRRDPERWARRIAIGALCAGVAWGGLIVVPGVGAEIWIQFFIAFVVAGMSAAALASLVALLRACMPDIIAILLPLPVMLALHGDPPRLAMALMAMFYLFLLVRLAYRINDVIVTGIRLRQQNEEMFCIFEKSRTAKPPSD
jgi:hypothetical protein